NVTIPSGSAAEFSFWFQIANPGLGLAEDLTEVRIDGDQLWMATAADSTTYADYTEVTVDITSYADGNPHVLYVYGIQSTVDVVNFLFDDMSMTVDGTDQVSINELLSAEKDVVLYPNPAREQTSLYFNANASGDAVVSIYALNGALVNRQQLQDISDKVFDFDTEILDAGMYSVVVETEHGLISKRLVVTK
ncbi:MAG: T9SS type A sorting domain-containing protein, partial [Flavobacteriales bacterium]|nr:T9SS type A sorting domain-containing protein [Flavobacteriales bacterium]